MRVTNACMTRLIFSFLFSREKENVWGSHWSTGEPRRSDCVALNLTSGSLFTHNCRDKMSFVCENRGTSDLYESTIPKFHPIHILSNRLEKPVKLKFRKKIFEFFFFTNYQFLSQLL